MRSNQTIRMNVAGVHRYTVRIPEQIICDEAGNELEGLSIESRRLILISRAVEPERREEILGHELTHCWAFHVPLPRTEEERAQLTATIAQQMRMDLESLGGVEALVSLELSPISLPYKLAPMRKIVRPAMTMPQVQAWECGGCGTSTMCGSIENGPHIFHEGLSQHQMQRWFRCEFCGALMVWNEVATEDGQATGVLIQVPAPKLLYGAAASEWLAVNYRTAIR